MLTDDAEKTILQETEPNSAWVETQPQVQHNNPAAVHDFQSSRVFQSSFMELRIKNCFN